jgi:mRNA interferase HigB
MHVISKKRLQEFWTRHPASKEPLLFWFNITRRAAWQNISEVRQNFPHADGVGQCTVFNIKGNDYRLISHIDYRFQQVYVRFVLTHAEYDREVWKGDC